ncbi:helix-turn-helix domain-containing protein [Vulgatibacter incomptus]|nr:helix-turn-helix transcriptional regulator [Vulgatibacter incomptus]
MESFGRYLVQQRELRGMSPGDVIRVTKLSPSAIEALENDRFDRLPGRTFVVGYLRAYAACVGLNPDEVVLRYEEHASRLPPPEDTGVPRLTLKGAAGPMPIRFVFLGAAVVLIALAAYLLFVVKAAG